MYKSHLAEFMKDIEDRHFLEVSVDHIHVIEFQKRSFLHCHMLVVLLRNEAKQRNSYDIVRIVTTEIPDANDYPALHDFIKST